MNAPRRGLFALLACACALASPARADDIEDTLLEALEVYRAGDIEETGELIEDVKSLLLAARVEALAGFLPPAPEGWTKTVSEADEAAVFTAFGGGSAASAVYVSPDGDEVQVTVMGDSPMLAMMGAQLSNPTLMRQMGDVRRVQGERVLLNDEGLQALIDDRFLVQISGSTDADLLVSLFEGVDVEGLEDF